LNDRPEHEPIMSSVSVEFEQLCREALERAGDASSAAKDRIIEDLRLRFEYPGEYIAYLDRYETVNKLRRLHRRLIAHSADLGEVQGAIRAHPKHERPKIALEYAEPLGEDISSLPDLPFR
jgi:hypothetical protein